MKKILVFVIFLIFSSLTWADNVQPLPPTDSSLPDSMMPNETPVSNEAVLPPNFELPTVTPAVLDEGVNERSQNPSPQTEASQNYTILDLIHQGMALKGKTVYGNFKIVQKINAKSYLVQPYTGITEFDGRIFYVYGDKNKDNSFDYYDGEAVRLWVVVEGSYSYTSVIGATSTVIKLKDNKIETGDELGESKWQSAQIVSPLDLVRGGLDLKGQKVRGYFRIVQKINLRSYLITLNYAVPPDMDSWPNYYIEKDPGKDFQFDFVDDESVYLTAIIGNSFTYETVTGSTATVIRLKAVDCRPGNYSDEHPTKSVGFYTTDNCASAEGEGVFNMPLQETIEWTNERNGTKRTYRLGTLLCGGQGYIAVSSTE